MTLFERINLEKKYLNSNLSEIEHQLRDAPDGCIMCHKNGGSFKYYQRISNSDDPSRPIVRYLNKKEGKLKRRLAEKTLLMNRRQDILTELHAIDAYLKIHREPPEKEFMRVRNSPGLQKLLHSQEASHFNSLLAEELASWADADFPSNPDYPEHLTFKTEKGESVRSKSEMMIAHLLFSNHIPYRYENPLSLGFTSIYPDFTIRHPSTGDVFIWEHFGLMDQPDYVSKGAWKLQRYFENGYHPGKNLILTYESANDPFDFQEAQKIIKEKFLT